jgi:hypothetical protein
LKRLLTTVTLALATVLLSSAPSGAESHIARGFPLRVTATTTPGPPRERERSFTTTGRVVPPSRYCRAGVSPTEGEGNCIPIICPPGETERRYCFVPGQAAICSGFVTVTFQKGNTTVSSRTVALRPDCTYSSRVTFRTRLGRLTVTARFLGNAFLRPKASAPQTVWVG